MKRSFFILLALGAVYYSCTKMAPEEAGPEEPINCTPQFPDQNVTYHNYVKNIIARNCTVTCHKGGNTLGPGNFTTYAGVRAYTQSSFFFRVITDQADMPQGKAPLPKSTRDSLNIWLKNCSPEGQAN